MERAGPRDTASGTAKIAPDAEAAWDTAAASGPEAGAAAPHAEQARDAGAADPDDTAPLAWIAGRPDAAASGETTVLWEAPPAGADFGGEPPRRASPWRAWLRAAIVAAIGGCVVALAAAAYRGAWLAAHVTVPALPGRTVADAARAVVPLDLGVVVVSRRQDARAPVGVIVAQAPAPGSRLTRGSVIELTVSEGSGIVPPLAGRSLAQAARMLEAAGLRLGQVGYSPDDQVPAGAVIYQYRAPGSRLPPNGAVNVLASQGPPATPPVTPWFEPAPGTGHDIGNK